MIHCSSSSSLAKSLTAICFLLQHGKASSLIDMKPAPNRVITIPIIYTVDKASSRKKKHMAVNQAELVLKIADEIPAVP